jgi:hypothetical protein
VDEQTFLTLDDPQVAAYLRAGAPPCWALALGGTRRAYIAQGGVLATDSDLEAYFEWIDTIQRQLLTQLYALGVETVLTVGRVAKDRGAVYQQIVTRTLRGLTDSPARSDFYNQLNLRVCMAGDLAALGDALAAPDLVERCGQLAQKTANNTGPRLIYLFRGDWIDPAIEEASFGYQLGVRLGRLPTRSEVVQSFYGADIPPLTAYLGSGRPQIAHLRPPFLTGTEDLYWSVVSPIRLARRDWLRLIYDHLWSRRTHSARTYPADMRSQLASTLAAHDGQILGIGRRHALGFWMPITVME